MFEGGELVAKSGAFGVPIAGNGSAHNDNVIGKLRRRQ